MLRWLHMALVFFYACPYYSRACALCLAQPATVTQAVLYFKHSTHLYTANSLLSECHRHSCANSVNSQEARKRMQLKTALSISGDLSQQITDDMLQQMGQGLAGSSESTMLMLPSWLPSLPTGHETGTVLAVDFGGTSFRVMEVVLGKRPNHVVCHQHLPF